MVVATVSGVMHASLMPFFRWFFKQCEVHPLDLASSGSFQSLLVSMVYILEKVSSDFDGSANLMAGRASFSLPW